MFRAKIVFTRKFPLQSSWTCDWKKHFTANTKSSAILQLCGLYKTKSSKIGAWVYCILLYYFCSIMSLYLHYSSLACIYLLCSILRANTFELWHFALWDKQNSSSSKVVFSPGGCSRLIRSCERGRRSYLCNPAPVCKENLWHNQRSHQDGCGGNVPDQGKLSALLHVQLSSCLLCGIKHEL